MSLLTTKASRPADARICSSEIFHSCGIHPKKELDKSGKATSGFSRFLRAAYSEGHLGRRIFTWR